MTECFFFATAIYADIKNITITYATKRFTKYDVILHGC